LERTDECAMMAHAANGIQVGDVAGAEGEQGAQRLHDRRWLRPGQQPALDRPVPVALAAPGMDHLAGHKIKNGEDVHGQ
jgi:hypothetical protein